MLCVQLLLLIASKTSVLRRENLACFEAEKLRHTYKELNVIDIYRLSRSMLLGLVGLMPMCAHCQVQGTQGNVAFEVSTIKPSHAEGDSVDRMIKPLPGGNGYMARNFPVRLMIALMYKVPVRQVQGGPKWLDEEYFDIDAHADGVHSKEDLQAMFRSLLMDRFGLQMHKVSHEGKVFNLQVDGAASKMHDNPAGPGMNIPVVPVGVGQFRGQGVSMAYFCWFLGQQIQDKERPVIDETGLTGTYDFKLSFLPDSTEAVDPEALPPELRNRPSLFAALQEQLGLRLVAGTGPVPYFIIDHVERPSPN